VSKDFNCFHGISSILFSFDSDRLETQSELENYGGIVPKTVKSKLSPPLVPCTWVYNGQNHGPFGSRKEGFRELERSLTLRSIHIENLDLDKDGTGQVPRQSDNLDKTSPPFLQ